MTTTAASTPDVQARIFFLLPRVALTGAVAPGAVASAFAAGGIVPIGCFGAGSPDGALCRGELASPYCSAPRALPSDGPEASSGRGPGVPLGSGPGASPWDGPGASPWDGAGASP